LTYKNFKSENVTTESKNLAKGPDFEDCRWGGMWAVSCISGRWEPRTTSTGSEEGREGKITHQQVLGTECFTKIYTARVGKEGEKGCQKERRENIEKRGEGHSVSFR
jgi:hypothetical protein